MAATPNIRTDGVHRIPGWPIVHQYDGCRWVGICVVFDHMGPTRFCGIQIVLYFNNEIANFAGSRFMPDTEVGLNVLRSPFALRVIQWRTPLGKQSAHGVRCQDTGHFSAFEWERDHSFIMK